jgi:serine/threonine protein kinase
MPLSPGDRFGPYEILAALGEGGMGEVYKARDTRLDRDVAVKVLTPHLTESPQARERFKREARAVAALPHPNICTIHDVGETSDGRAFLVMELLDGETLQDRLSRGPLDTPALLDVAIALADALVAAHDAAIVHRDIKPANIFLTARGPKLLDFGLAKPSARAAGDESWQPTASHSPSMTESGSTLGTLAYMSPEQLRGEELDERSDLFSFGLVLYEMATGRRAFSGATAAVIGAAILHDEPVPPRAVRSDVPEPLERAILKAIEKDRTLRYQHASELRADLLRLKRDTE